MTVTEYPEHSVQNIETHSYSCQSNRQASPGFWVAWALTCPSAGQAFLAGFFQPIRTQLRKHPLNYTSEGWGSRGIWVPGPRVPQGVWSQERDKGSLQWYRQQADSLLSLEVSYTTPSQEAAQGMPMPQRAPVAIHTVELDLAPCPHSAQLLRPKWMHNSLPPEVS